MPKAIRAPTPISSLVHRSTLVTAGLFLLINLFEINNFINVFVFWVIFFTLVFSGLLAILEKDFKKIIALRTISQIRFCFFIFNINFIYFCFIHICSHAFFKSCLFIQSGYFMFLNFREQIKEKIIKNPSLIFFRFFLVVFCLIGLFFNGGLLRKDFLLEIFFNFN